jgi:myo-inositol catabolism protein IolC
VPVNNTFVLAVDHRNSLRQWLRSLSVAPAEIDVTARRLKTLCALALDGASGQLAAGQEPMLLVDEEYGLDAIAEARSRGLNFVIPVEVSGRAEFLFEHGARFREAIEAVDPYAVKALVRYNVDGDAQINRRSRARLVQLQRHLRVTGRRFLLELLVPPTDRQQLAVGGSYDDELRPGLTARAIAELAADGLRPDWWKLEGNNDPAAADVVSVAAGMAAEVGCLVLGRGQSLASVVRWIQVAAPAGSFVGFAVGRTLWSDPFRMLVTGELDSTAAAERIAATYLDIAREYARAAVAAN